MTDLQQAVKELQDTLIVISEIERRQSAMLKEHSERIVAMELHGAQFRERTEGNLAEMTDKLNGLIGYMDGQHKPPQ